VKPRGPAISRPTADIHAVSVRIIALPREILPRVAIHAARMLKDARYLREQFAAAR
jgi:hypothetical protein